MKKSLVWLSAPLLAVLLALPALAFQVKIGTRLYTEVGYVWRTGNAYGNNDSRMPDLTTFFVGLPRTNYLRLDWTGDDKSTGARIEFGLGAGPVHGAAVVVLRHMYGWYKFGQCRLVIGHTHNLFAPMSYAPYQWLGRAGGGLITSRFLFGNWATGPNAPTHLFLGHGKQYSGRFAQIALYYAVGPWTFMIALGQAPTTNADMPGGVASAAHTLWPRVDLVIQYQAKWIALAPGVSVYLSEREPIEGAGLQDDRILSYALVLPFRFSFGAFRIKGELSHGRNWVAANYLPSQAGLNRAGYWGGNNDPGRIKVEDTFFFAACLGLEYHLGRVSLHLGGGWQKSSNAGNDQINTYRHGQNVRYAFNFAIKYRVNRHFVIAPEISYWLYGWNPWLDVGDGNAVQADYGSAWLAGVSFQVSF